MTGNQKTHRIDIDDVDNKTKQKQQVFSALPSELFRSDTKQPKFKDRNVKLRVKAEMTMQELISGEPRKEETTLFQSAKQKYIQEGKHIKSDISPN